MGNSLYRFGSAEGAKYEVLTENSNGHVVSSIISRFQR